MGQYWIPVNLTKREFVSPHKLGAGLKLWEQLANHPGTGGALIILYRRTAYKRVRGRTRGHVPHYQGARFLICRALVTGELCKLRKEA